MPIFFNQVGLPRSFTIYVGVMMNNKHKITRLSALAVVLLMLLVSLMPVFNVNPSEVFATQSSTGDNSYTYTLK